MGRALIPSILLGMLLWLSPAAALAQLLRPEVRDPFLADPLVDDPQDPLLPDYLVNRDLSPLEKRYLAEDLDELDQEAIALLEAGNTDEAYELWLREVRLRRLLGLDPELVAIERVGQRFWDGGRTQEVQLLTARLEAIRDALLEDSQLDTRLETVADRFVQLGEPDAATGIYRQLADAAAAAGNTEQARSYEETIGGIQLRWFQFAEAALTYEVLGETSRSALERQQHLQRMVYSYEQLRRWPQALAGQQRLLELYQQENLQELTAPLHLAMGKNHQAAGQLDPASRQYQRAYALANAQEQFDVAQQSILALTALYRQLERFDDVVYLCQQLVLVAQQAYDAYGILTAYEQLGQAYEQLGQLQQAQAAYREAWVLARHLNHRADYFQEQVQRLDAPEPTAPAPAEESLPLQP